MPPPARPWITDSVVADDGSHEVQVTYPNGQVAWITVPPEAAGAVDLIRLAEIAERRPPPTLAAGGGEVPGDQGAENTGR